MDVDNGSFLLVFFFFYFFSNSCRYFHFYEISIIYASWSSLVPSKWKGEASDSFSLQVFHKRMPAEAVDLVSRLLQYSPTLRCTAVSNLSLYVHLRFWSHCLIILTSEPTYLLVSNCVLHIFQLEACAHPFFDSLKEPNASLPNGRPLPPLFNFTPQGKQTLWLVLLVLFDILVRCFWLSLNFLQNYPVHPLNYAIALFLHI